MTYETRVTRVMVAPKGGGILSELATHIEIDDEGAGEFLRVHQEGGSTTSKAVLVNPEEWPQLKAAIEQMLKGIKQPEK